MTHAFIHNNKQIPINIKNSPRAKRITITVKKSGELLLTKPKYISQDTALLLISEKTVWIKNNLDLLEKRATKVSPLFKYYKSKKYNDHKQEAKEIIENLVYEINSGLEYVFKKIYIRNQSTRWASCSKRGNLSFNFKVAYLPPDLRRYVIVHELCHLVEFNHSPKFWKLVESQVPNYKFIRKKLKNNF